MKEDRGRAAGGRVCRSTPTTLLLLHAESNSLPQLLDLHPARHYLPLLKDRTTASSHHLLVLHTLSARGRKHPELTVSSAWSFRSIACNTLRAKRRRCCQHQDEHLTHTQQMMTADSTSTSAAAAPSPPAASSAAPASRSTCRNTQTRTRRNR